MRTTESTVVLTATGMRVALANGSVLVERSDLMLREGEILGLVGESGSGKTTLALSTMGYARPGLQIVDGTVEVNGVDGCVSKSRNITYVPQNPGTALNPALTIRSQLSEALMLLSNKGKSSAESRALVTMLADVKLPSSDAFLDSYPHQLSGGQQQRICIAMAFAAKPRVVVMDEPTTGLDVTTQRHILEMIKQLCEKYSASILYISHDLAVVSAICARIAVMHKGVIVETGTAQEVLKAPQHPYSKKLLACVPEFDPDQRSKPEQEQRLPLVNEQAGHSVIAVRDLSVAYGNYRVIEHLSLDVREGECLALVGESGSGKTTLARCIAGIHAGVEGGILLAGEPLLPLVRSRTTGQRKAIQYIFQNPYTTFNPSRTIRRSLLAALTAINGRRSGADLRILTDAMEQVALDGTYLDRYPHQLSGGQRQRVAIARALISEPKVLICDEVTSALDVSVQAVIVDLLDRLRRERGLTMLFVTHNMALVRNFAQRVAVMQRGKIVDVDLTDRIFSSPSAEETRRLIEDTPKFIRPRGANSLG